MECHGTVDADPILQHGKGCICMCMYIHDTYYIYIYFYVMQYSMYIYVNIIYICIYLYIYIFINSVIYKYISRNAKIYTIYIYIVTKDTKTRKSRAKITNPQLVSLDFSYQVVCHEPMSCCSPRASKLWTSWWPRPDGWVAQPRVHLQLAGIWILVFFSTRKWNIFCKVRLTYIPEIHITNFLVFHNSPNSEILGLYRGKVARPLQVA